MTVLLLALALRLAPNPPSLALFGPGPFTNLRDEQAWTNAIAHVWFGTACPLALSRWTGLRTWQVGAICGGAILARQTFWHGATPGPEVRTDLISGLLPILAVVAIDAVLR